jgi:hypothetical protein
LERDGQKARKEMVKHVEQVSNDLMAIQKKEDLRFMYPGQDGFF